MRVASPIVLVISRLSAALLAGVIALTLARSSAQAANRTFTIYGGDGYGVDDCLSAKSGCGRSVADAWCTTHGLSRAVAFGSSADVTGSIGAAPASQPAAMIITCAK